MNSIELPIFHHTDETKNFDNIGLEFNLADNAEIREMTFFIINAIAPYLEGEKKYSSIHSNGQEYICSLKYESVKDLILKTFTSL